MYLLPEVISFILGCVTTVAMIRYGMSLGTNIVRRTQDGLPAFGEDIPPIMQSNTNGTEDEREEVYEDDK